MIQFLMILSILNCISVDLYAQSSFVEGRFVAFDKFAALGNPRAPHQLLVVEQNDASKRLIKVIYFPKTDGLRGGAQFLPPEDLNYKLLWTLSLRVPTKGEKTLCEIDGFFRSADGTVDLDAKQEPVLRFRSTQVEADLKLDGLSKFPCLVAEELDKVD